jgi:hypothetical protein
MLELLEWLENTGLGRLARESLYGFQVLVAIHILGLIFSLGLLLWVDLRMLGVCLTEQRLSQVYAALARWFVVGFAVMFTSGAALFAGFATSAYENGFFLFKMAVIALAGLNALLFHMLQKRLPASANAGPPPGTVRLAGALSIAFWATVLVCGRILSYTLF